SGPHLTGDGLPRFDAVTGGACAELGRAIVDDAAGAEHLVTSGAEVLPSDADARRVAKAIAESALVKAAIYGADPNWGRFVSAAGYAGGELVEAHLTLWMGPFELYRAGAPLPFDAKAASAYLRDNREVHLRLRFTLG